MSRIAPPETVSSDLDALLKSVAAQMGFVPNSLLAMSRRPTILREFLALGGAVMGPGGAVPSSLKQMIAYVASLSAGCRYCQAHTAHQVHRAGEDSEKLAALWSFDTSPLFSAAERSALRLALLAAQNPNGVDEADFAEARAHFSDDALTEVVSVIAFFGFLNRWNDTLATPLEDAPLAFAELQLSAPNWKVGKHRT